MEKCNLKRNHIKQIPSMYADKVEFQPDTYTYFFNTYFLYFM